jgi:hypothetical protein
MLMLVIVIDHDGNRVNSLIVQKDSINQDAEQTTSSDTTAMETQTIPDETPVARSSSSHDDTEEPAKPEDLPIKLSEPDIIPPQTDITVLKERDRVVPQHVEDKTNIVLPGHENKGGELVGVNEKGETPNRDIHQAAQGVGENSELSEAPREPDGGGPIKPVEDQPLESETQAGAEQQAKESSLTPLPKEHEGTISSTEYETSPIQPVEETVDEFTEVFNSSDELALIEGSFATKEPAPIEIPNLTEEMPIPHAAAETALSGEQQAHGGGAVEDGSLQEIVENREVDAIPEEPQPSREGGPEKTSESVYIPSPVVEKTDDKPTHGGDLGADDNHAQKVTSEKWAVDVKPVDVLVSPEQESGSGSAVAEAVAKYNGHLPATMPDEVPETENALETVATPDAEGSTAVADTSEAEKAPEATGTQSVEETTAIAGAPGIAEVEELGGLPKTPVVEEVMTITEAIELGEASEAEKAAEQEKDAGSEKALEVVDAPEAKGITEPEEAEPAEDPGQEEAPIVEEAPETGAVQELTETLGAEEVPEVQDIANPGETPAVEEVTELGATEGTTRVLEAEEVLEEIAIATEATKSAETPVLEQVMESEAVQRTTGDSETEKTPGVQGTAVVAEAAKPVETLVVGEAVGLEMAPDTTGALGAGDAPELRETVEIIEAAKPVKASIVGEIAESESEATLSTPAAIKVDEIAVGEAVEPEAMLGITEAPEPEKATEPEAPETAEIPKSDETTEALNHTNLMPKTSTQLVENAAPLDAEKETDPEAIETNAVCDENAAIHQHGMERSIEVHGDSEQLDLERTANEDELVKDASYSHDSKTVPVPATGMSQMRDDPAPIEADAVESLASVLDKDLETPTNLAHTSEAPDTAAEDTPEAHNITGAIALVIPDERKFAIEDELKDDFSVEHPPTENNERENHIAITDAKGESPDAVSLGNVAIDTSGVLIHAIPSQTEITMSAAFPETGVDENSMEGYPGTGVVTGNEPSGIPKTIEELPGTGKVKEKNLAEIPEVADNPISTIAPKTEGLGENPKAVGSPPKIEVAEGEDLVGFPNLTDRSPETEALKEEVSIKTPSVGESPETVETKGGDSSEVPEAAKESASEAYQDLDATTTPKVVHGKKKAEDESLGEARDEEKSREVVLGAIVAELAPTPTLHDPSASAPGADTAAACPTDTTTKSGKLAENPGHLLQEQELAPDLGSSEGKESSPTANIINTATEIAKPARPASGEEHVGREGPSLSKFAAAIGHDHETNSPRIEDAPLFAHERLTPCEERPVDSKHLPRTPVTVSESLPEPEEPSVVDLEDPLLESFPSDREHIFERLRTTESRLEEDETAVEGIPPSPILSNGNGNQPIDLASGRSSSPVERSPNLDAIPEEEASTLPEAASAVPEGRDSQTASIATASISAALVGVTATAVASQLKGSSDEGTSQNERSNDLLSAEPPGVVPSSTQMSSPPATAKTEQSMDPDSETSKTVQDIPVLQVSSLPKEHVPDPLPTSVPAELSPSISKRPRVDEAAKEAKPEPASHCVALDESTGESGLAASENASAAIISTVAPTSSTAALAAETGLELRDTTSGAAKESQIEVHRPTDAGTLPDAIIDKATVEGEPENHVPPESPRNESITQGDTGVVNVSGISTLSPIISTENIQFTPNDTTLNAPQVPLENQDETHITDETNSSTIATEGKISTEGGLEREVPLEQGASAGTLNGADSTVDAKNTVIAGAVIGAAILVEGVAPSMKVNAKDNAFDNSQNTAQSTAKGGAEDEPQFTIQHTVAESAQGQGETDAEVSASSKTRAENRATQAKPKKGSGVVEDTPGDGLRQRKVTTDTGDRPQTPHSLQSTKGPKHSNIFKTFWRTVFGGWIGGLFSKIFSSKRHRA